MRCFFCFFKRSSLLTGLQLPRVLLGSLFRLLPLGCLFLLLGAPACLLRRSAPRFRSLLLLLGSFAFRPDIVP